MLKGGFRTLINDYDFKYTINQERINWVKSTFSHVKKLVEIVSKIPINEFTYSGSIFFSYEFYNDEKDDDDTKFNPNINEEKNEEEKMIKYKEYTINNLINSLTQNFFGGISFELLNDCYKDVDLYTYVDPTGDVDIVIKTKNKFPEINKEFKDFRNELSKQRNEGTLNYFDININVAIVYYDEKLPNVPILNPYFKGISDFIFNYMLEQLNKTNMVIENSVDFDINDYDEIGDSVKTEYLNFRYETINNSNAKLVCYLDNNFETLRVQIVIAIFKDGTKNIDHLLEFLIKISEEKYFNLVCSEENPMNYKISPISTLVNDNLRAYKERISLLKDERELSHKPRNHFCRFIYLLTLFKYYPDFYNNLDNLEKTNINGEILRFIYPEYSFYIVKQGILKEVIIKTINVIYAFYSVFENTMKIHPINWKRIGKKIGAEIEQISQEQETEEYNKLLSLFRINASSFRKFSSKQDLPPLIEGGKYKHVKKNTRKYKKTHKRKNRKTKKRNRKK